MATLHGVLMWFTWTILALVQLGTSRYMKHYWRYSQMIHNTVGIFSGIISIASLIIILKSVHFQFYWAHWHNILGTAFIGILFSLVLGGIFAITIKRFSNFEWQTKKMLKLASIHKYFAYFVIITVQITICTGIMRRVTYQ